MRLFRFTVFSLVLFLCACAAFGTIFGTVRGVVHDPQHRPVQDAAVDLKAQHSDWVQHQKTNGDGEFDFSAVPLGEYTITVTLSNFRQAQENVIVASGSSPVLHIQLELAGVSEETVVTGEPVSASLDSVTPTTLLSRETIQDTPGADRTNSLAIITEYVPGSYVTHDQLHIRGGHQVSWLIDGVPVPNTNIASNVGPQFDPKDIDYMEVQRGSYDADYGDRTYGVFNVVPRTGLSGTMNATSSPASGISTRPTTRSVAAGTRSDLRTTAVSTGIEAILDFNRPPCLSTHDAENGFGGFGSLIYNVDPKDQLRFVISSRRDYYQIPYDPVNVPVEQRFCATANMNRMDSLEFSWVHTVSSNMLLTVSPFYHFNRANYDTFPSTHHRDHR